MPARSPDTLLRDAAAALQALVDGPASARADLVPPLLDELLEVRLRARDGMELGDFPARTADLVNRVAHNLQFAVGDLTDRVNGAGGELNWTRASRRRSGIEAVRELYAGHMPAGNLPDTSDLDEVLEAAAPLYGPAREIPPRIPVSDWWWWAPSSPPARGSSRGPGTAFA
jgi:hypothetical protein